MRAATRFVRDPNAALAFAAAGAIAAEAAFARHLAVAWYLLEALLLSAALLYAWRVQDRLRLLPLLLLTAATQLGFLAVHEWVGIVHTDLDWNEYMREGRALLDGDRLDDALYPPGAVLMFVVETALADTPRIPNALVMVGFQVVAVAAVWSLRNRYAAWLAAAVAIWPMNAFFLEFKFDAAPAALLAVGLALALAARWPLAGIVLALGAAVKWTPGLAALALAVWLVSGRRRPEAARFVLAFAATLLLAHAALAVIAPEALPAPYRRHGDSPPTPESVWYLLLAPLGLADADGLLLSRPADVPSWGSPLAALVQAALVIGVIVLCSRARSRQAAVAAAAMVPAAFLLTNRVFSAQYVLFLGIAWAVAGALVVHSRREQLAVGGAVLGTSLATTLVYPYGLPAFAQTWPVASSARFVLGFGLTAWIVVRSLEQRFPDESLERDTEEPGGGRGHVNEPPRPRRVAQSSPPG